MEIFKKYWTILLIVVAVSYGQILFMQPWQDDNALFFKLAHIEEPAGFLGKGVFGEGAYKYTAFFYYPIYLLLGYQTEYYFALSFIFYFLSCLSVYALAKRILGEKAGRVAGFLYAAGYVAFDGFIRLFNSVVTSVSIILISFLTYFYWRFYKEAKVKWYIFSLLAFFLAMELAQARTHYLIGVIVAFELIFLAFKKLPLSLAKSLLRLSPFFYIFYRYFVVNADARSGQVVTFLSALARGEFYQTYGFFSSLTNLVLPDWMIKDLPAKFFLLSRKMFTSPVLNLSPQQKFVAFLGIIIIFVGVFIFTRLKGEKRHIFSFFGLWVLVNIAAYAAYQPTVSYESTNRLLAHSFFALVGVWAALFSAIKVPSVAERLFVGFIFLWGIGNLTNAFLYQRRVVKERSLPVANFYKELKGLLPVIEKGDVIYFDVADDAKGYFADAFSVAQMPETTAIAWRYRIDRYDFYLAENYDNLKKIILEENIPIEKIHTFYYSKETGLISTTDKYQNLAKGFLAQEKSFEFKELYSCVLRPTLTFSLSATPEEKSKELLAKTDLPVTKALAYVKAKKDFYSSAKVFASSFWRERATGNLIDQNPDTVWQADRVTWDEELTFFGFDLGQIRSISKLAWVNGFGNNTPTLYSVEVSLDNKVWIKVAEIEKIGRIDDKIPQEITFAPAKARYIRMVIAKTLNSDSAGIAEAWMVPAEFEKDRLADLENYLLSPQLALLQGVSPVTIYWKSNAANGWQTDATAKFNLITDGRVRNYRVSLPCRGTELSEVKLEGFQFPLDSTLHDLEVSYQPKH